MVIERLRRGAMRLLPRDSLPWRLAREVYRPFSWTVGTVYHRLGYFPSPGIVIGGASRSGTTLLQAMLGAHPDILLVDHETYAFCPSLREEHFYDPEVFELYRLYAPIALSGGRRGAARWCEKTPRNILYARAILSRLGDDVRLVHIVRDGRDVVTSRHPRRPGDYYWSPEGWVQAVRAGLAVDDDPRVHRLRYEDLVANPRGTLGELLEFLEESWCPEMDDWRQHTGLRRHSAWFGQVRDVDTRSVERWRHPEHAERVRLFLNTPGAAELLGRLGYPV